ncbi:MAG: hypothetical protein ACOC8H_02050, partial [bacterium]
GMIDEYGKHAPVTMTAEQIGDVRGNMVGADLSAGAANRARALAQARNDASRLSYRGATPGQVRDTLAAAYTPAIADDIVDPPIRQRRADIAAASMPLPDVESVAPETAGAGLPGIQDPMRDLEIERAKLGNQNLKNQIEMNASVPQVSEGRAPFVEQAVSSAVWPEMGRGWFQSTADWADDVGDSKASLAASIRAGANTNEQKAIGQMLRSTPKYNEIVQRLRQLRSGRDWEGTIGDWWDDGAERKRVIQGLESIVSMIDKAAQTGEL